MSGRWLRIAAVIVLGIYSVSLVMTEVLTSQSFARNYFTDITGPVRFYAVNTTLSVFLLWATALIFAVCLACTTQDDGPKERAFYLSQILAFGLLGLDDRFLLHEWLGGKLEIIDDAFLLLGAGVLEVALIVTLGGLMERSARVKLYLCLAAFFFGSMVFIDAYVPEALIPRLSLEDLSKTWGAAFLFASAWSILGDKIEALKKGARSSRSG